MDQNQAEIDRLRHENQVANDMLKELTDTIGWLVIGPRPKRLRDVYHQAMAYLDDQGT
jgi:hypothetical protein